MEQIYILGKLTEEGDHFNYSHCTEIDDNKVCGYDLYENLMPMKVLKPEYSTELFTRKAVEHIQRHDGQKVGTEANV